MHSDLSINTDVAS